MNPIVSLALLGNLVQAQAAETAAPVDASGFQELMAQARVLAEQDGLGRGAPTGNKLAQADVQITSNGQPNRRVRREQARRHGAATPQTQARPVQVGLSAVATVQTSATAVQDTHTNRALSLSSAGELLPAGWSTLPRLEGIARPAATDDTPRLSLGSNTKGATARKYAFMAETLGAGQRAKSSAPVAKLAVQRPETEAPNPFAKPSSARSMSREMSAAPQWQAPRVNHVRTVDSRRVVLEGEESLRSEDWSQLGVPQSLGQTASERRATVAISNVDPEGQQVALRSQRYSHTLSELDASLTPSMDVMVTNLEPQVPASGTSVQTPLVSTSDLRAPFDGHAHADEAMLDETLSLGVSVAQPAGAHVGTASETTRHLVMTADPFAGELVPSSKPLANGSVQYPAVDAVSDASDTPIHRMNHSERVLAYSGGVDSVDRVNETVRERFVADANDYDDEPSEDQRISDLAEVPVRIRAASDNTVRLESSDAVERLNPFASQNLVIADAYGHSKSSDSGQHSDLVEQTDLRGPAVSDAVERLNPFASPDHVVQIADDVSSHEVHRRVVQSADSPQRSVEHNPRVIRLGLPTDASSRVLKIDEHGNIRGFEPLAEAQPQRQNGSSHIEINASDTVEPGLVPEQPLDATRGAWSGDQHQQTPEATSPAEPSSSVLPTDGGDVVPPESERADSIEVREASNRELDASHKKDDLNRFSNEEAISAPKVSAEVNGEKLDGMDGDVAYETVDSTDQEITQEALDEVREINEDLLQEQMAAVEYAEDVAEERATIVEASFAEGEPVSGDADAEGEVIELKSSTADSDSAFSDEDDAGSEEWEQTRQDENVGFEAVAAELTTEPSKAPKEVAKSAPVDAPAREIPLEELVDVSDAELAELAEQTVRVEVDQDMAVEVTMTDDGVDVVLDGNRSTLNTMKGAESEMERALRDSGHELSSFSERDRETGEQKRRMNQRRGRFSKQVDPEGLKTVRRGTYVNTVA